jgi:signal transduction histidine kinase
VANNLILVLFAAVGAAMAWLVARRAGDAATRRAWLGLALAQVCVAGGDLLWISYTLRGLDPFPSLADILYLLADLLLLGGLLSFPTQRRSISERRVLLLDLAAIGVGGAMLIWYLLQPNVAAGAGVPLGLALIYPVGDLILLLALSLVSLRQPLTLSRSSSLLFASALILLLVADLSFVSASVNYTNGGPIDLIWLLGRLLFIAACVVQGSQQPRPGRAMVHSALPYIVIAIGYGLLIVSAVDYVNDTVGGLIIGAVMLTTLLVVRQVLAMHENMQLLEERAALAAQAQQAAEAANRAHSSFLSVMSHELRTPLTSILGYSELLMLQAEQRQIDDLVPDLREIERAGHQLLGMINNVLDLVKIEAGTLSLDPQPFDLVTFIDDIALATTSLVTANGNQFQIECPSDIGGLLLDPLRLRQILMQLLSNAAKFTHNGSVRLRVSRQDQPPTTDGNQALADSRAALVAGPASIIFEIQDSGIGISPEQLDQLFQPFAQLHTGMARQYGGSGLGLAIAQRLCQLLGGRLSVTSAPGAGSTFSVHLPVAQA